VSNPDVIQAAWERVAADQKRQDFLNSLYFLYGRDAKDHPMHSLYTGLYQQWLADGCPTDSAVRDGGVLGDLRTGDLSV